MKFNAKLLIPVLLGGLFTMGYSEPEVTTQWSNNLPGSNQSIEQVQADMNASDKEGSQSGMAEQVFQKEQNRNTALPSDPKLSVEALDYLTFCNEQLPNQLQDKYGATLLSASNVKSKKTQNSTILNYSIDALKGNLHQEYMVNCTIKNGKAKLDISEK
jgi:hypothetical protein